MSEGALGPWDEIVLPAMNSDSPMPEALRLALQRPGYSVQLTDAATAPFIRLPSSWEEYLAGLSKKQRYNLKSALRDFEAWSEGTTRLERVQAPEQLAEGQADPLHAPRGAVGSGRRIGRFLLAGLQRFPRFALAAASCRMRSI
jgi:hypothetical protein